ncbi:MAG: peptidase M1 [Crocinitomicaceae bacterium]|nr:peptidase M1 [Crocinitomicaceae bacterium]|tara:strand:- start:932 stop:2779 length:1848 start_codon:yes stop_codon:yes gene_type:complete
MKRIGFLLVLLIVIVSGYGQSCYWQQRVEYKMDVELDVKTHRMKGIQEVKYYNNSPDTLNKIYYHLYFNAFQPGSMMDARSRSISDPDSRIGSRIVRLKDDEIGYHKVDKLSINGSSAKYSIDGTLMTIELKEPLAPNSSIDIEMKFNSQVPKQIRRSGRNNMENVDYTMTQWYPKIAEYDRDGWMTDEYIGREFHGVWGDFDVKLTLDANYVVGGTGYLQNPEEVGHGYPLNGKEPQLTTGDLTWHFKAPNVHDFAWAADPDYTHDVRIMKNGMELHFLYIKDSVTENNWKNLQPYTEKNFNIMNATFGEYPYKQYSVIQGGDGGMEYPMATMITGKGSFGGLVSVMVHESIHSWYYGLLATNEAKYPWMDEGFTQFAQYHVLDSLYNRHLLNPTARAYGRYLMIANDPNAEPLTTHADFYHKNRIYGTNSYYKGTVFLKQLEYIIGRDNFYPAMRSYFNEWSYKHPTPTDFKRVMEKQSGMNLDWYFQQFLGTTKTIDYSIDEVVPGKKGTRVILKREGHMPMPVEFKVVMTDGSTKFYYIPLRAMRMAKNVAEDWETLAPWPWTHPYYEVELSDSFESIEVISLDPSMRVADTDLKNGVYKKGDQKVIFKGD